MGDPMFEIYQATQKGDYAPMFRALKALEPESRHAIVRLSPEAGAWSWIETLHHDLSGAVRAFRYLAEKSSAAYEAQDGRGLRALESIARHLETIEALQRNVIEKLLPLNAETPGS